jgi:hypothetical protein
MAPTPWLSPLSPDVGAERTGPVIASPPEYFAARVVLDRLEDPVEITATVVKRDDNYAAAAFPS